MNGFKHWKVQGLKQVHRLQRVVSLRKVPVIVVPNGGRSIKNNILWERLKPGSKYWIELKAMPATI